MPDITKEIIKIKGIDTINHPISSLGHIPITFAKVTHHFHVIDGLSIPYDGIIGSDAFIAKDGKIDYTTDSLILGDVTLPLSYKEPVYTIPARTESIIECTISNPQIKEGLVLDQRYSDNLLIANCLVTVKPNNRINISVVNTSESPITLCSNLNLVLTPIDEISCSPSLHENVYNISSGKENVLLRNQKTLDQLRVSHLNNEEITALCEVCSKFSDIFYLPGDKLSCTNAVKHEIPTSSTIPIHTKSYRFPEVHKPEVQKQIDQMLDQGIIKPSMSPWSSPIWVVPKKMDASGQRKWRVVIDYRKLNDITIGDAYPIPQISEILDQLGHSKYFSTLDLASGFHQIKMNESDASKTAFSVPQGHFEYTRMPFGLKNAPSTFQRLMNAALAGLQGIKCFVYLDDIVIYSHDLKTHCEKLASIFQRLRDFNLKLQPDKCEFLKKEVAYLGHIITEEGVKPNPEKIKAVTEFPTPLCPKDIKSFLGLVSYYRRFIPDFSKLSKPLTLLLKKDIPFLWQNEQQLSFEILKEALVTAPILAYPDFTQPFILTCDASNYAISAILSQGPIGNDRPIAYASRTLNKAECNYSVTEKECLAIVYGTQNFRPYLYGRCFKIVTDHRPLKWLFNCKEPGSKLVRWRLKLEDFNYEIVYKKGKINSNADALSRYPVNPVQKDSIPPISAPGQLEEPSELIDLGPLDLSPFNDGNVDFDSLNIPEPIPENPETEAELPLLSPDPCEDDYSQFLTAIQKNTQFNTKIVEHNESLLKTSSNIIIIPSSIDLDDSNPYVQELLSNCENSDEFTMSERELYSFKKLIVKGKTYYFIFNKVYHFSDSSYKDIFDTLQIIRNELLINNTTKEIAIPDFKNPFERHQFVKIYNMLSYLFNNTDIVVNIYHNSVIYPVPSEIPKILKENHDIPIAGHLGSSRMYNRIKERYFWKNMRSDIEIYVKNCKSCQSNKAFRKINKAPMQITTTASKPFDRISLDIVGPLPEAGIQKLRFILTLQDDLTKFSMAYPISNATAEESCECLVHFISVFGIPKVIVTDQGSNFTADLFKRTCEFLKIKQIWSSPYHPQTQGALERSHSTMKEYLKSYVNENQTDWHKYVYTAILAYNSNVHCTTQFTPYELLLGFKPYIPDSIYELNPNVTYPEYIKMLHHRMKLSRLKALENIVTSKERSKSYYDKHTRPIRYKLGDWVYLKNHLRLRKALSPVWKGPYRVVKIHGNNTLSLLINRRHVKHHFDQVKLASENLV